MHQPRFKLPKGVLGLIQTTLWCETCIRSIVQRCSRSVGGVLTPVLATWPIHARCHMRIRQVAITRFCTLDSECLDALMRAIRAITDQGIPDVIVGAPAVRTGEALYINALRRTPTTFHLTLGLDR
jgi:hypothetical protein